MFEKRDIFPGVAQMTDAMGVSMTLLTGNGRALLFDTGYGTEDVGAYVRGVTDKPVTVMLSHGHHDHILGARWFSRVYLSPEDLAEYRLRTGRPQREKVAAQAAAKGIPLPADFLSAACPEPTPVIGEGKTEGFDSLEMDLGGFPLRIFRVPGHTPGSLMIWIKKWKLLLTGDNWNPCTWLWFPSSVGTAEWKRNMERMLAACPCEHVLCSHQPFVRAGEEARRFIRSLTPERLRAAEKVFLDERIDTRQAHPDGDGMTFVFDWNKAALDG